MTHPLKHQLDQERALLRRIAFFEPLFTALYGWRGRGAIIGVAVVLFAMAVVWLKPFGASWQTEELRTRVLRLLLVLPLSAFLAANWLVEFTFKGCQIARWAVEMKLCVTARSYVTVALTVGCGVLAAFFHLRVQDGDLYSPLLILFAGVFVFASVVFIWDDSVRGEYSEDGTGDADDGGPESLTASRRK